MSCLFLSRLAARRIRFSALCTSARPCVRNVFCRRRFPLARPLFSISSAATEVVLFEDFLDTMDLSASASVTKSSRVRSSWWYVLRLNLTTRGANFHEWIRDIPISGRMVLRLHRVYGPRGVQPALAISHWVMLSSAGVQHVDTPRPSNFAAQYLAYTYPY